MPPSAAMAARMVFSWSVPCAMASEGSTLLGLRRVAAKLQSLFLFKTGDEMFRLPELAGGESGTGDERAGDAEAHEKFAPADGRLAMI